MTNTAATIPVGEPLSLHTLIAPDAKSPARRVVVKTTGGAVTLFAFNPGQGLPEHTPPVDALAVVLEGSVTLTIGGKPVSAPVGTLVRLPATVPHAVEATLASRMLLIVLRDQPAPSQGAASADGSSRRSLP